MSPPPGPPMSNFGLPLQPQLQHQAIQNLMVMFGISPTPPISEQEAAAQLRNMQSTLGQMPPFRMPQLGNMPVNGAPFPQYRLPQGPLMPPQSIFPPGYGMLPQMNLPPQVPQQRQLQQQLLHRIFIPPNEMHPNGHPGRHTTPFSSFTRNQPCLSFQQPPIPQQEIAAPYVIRYITSLGTSTVEIPPSFRLTPFFAPSTHLTHLLLKNVIEHYHQNNPTGYQRINLQEGNMIYYRPESIFIMLNTVLEEIESMYRAWLSVNPPDAMASHNAVVRGMPQIMEQAVDNQNKVSELLRRRKAARQQSSIDTTPPMFQPFSEVGRSVAEVNGFTNSQMDIIRDLSGRTIMTSRIQSREEKRNASEIPNAEEEQATKRARIESEVQIQLLESILGVDQPSTSQMEASPRFQDPLASEEIFVRKTVAVTGAGPMNASRNAAPRVPKHSAPSTSSNRKPHCPSGSGGSSQMSRRMSRKEEAVNIGYIPDVVTQQSPAAAFTSTPQTFSTFPPIPTTISSPDNYSTEVVDQGYACPPSSNSSSSGRTSAEVATSEALVNMMQYNPPTSLPPISTFLRPSNGNLFMPKFNFDNISATDPSSSSYMNFSLPTTQPLKIILGVKHDGGTDTYIDNSSPSPQ